MAGQLFGVNTLGGNYAALNLSRELRMGLKATAKFRQFCDVKDAWGKVSRSGQTFTWDVVPMMTRGNRQLTETTTIPQGQHTVQQATLTVYERGYSVPYSEFLESLSMVSVRAPIMEVLKYDALVDIDCTAFTQFNNTPLRAAATSSAVDITLTTNSTATVAATHAMGTVTVKSIVDTLKTRNVPPYSNGDYYCIGRPTGFRNLATLLESIAQYTPEGLAQIKRGEFGRYAGCRFVEQTVVPAGGAADSTTFNAYTDTADAWNQTANNADWAFFFGKDTVCEAIHTMEEIRVKESDDFRRARGIAWYALVGYGITHTQVAQARIIKWDSGS